MSTRGVFYISWVNLWTESDIRRRWTTVSFCNDYVSEIVCRSFLVLRRCDDKWRNRNAAMHKLVEHRTNLVWTRDRIIDIEAQNEQLLHTIRSHHGFHETCNCFMPLNFIIITSSIHNSSAVLMHALAVHESWVSVRMQPYKRILAVFERDECHGGNSTLSLV